MEHIQLKTIITSSQLQSRIKEMGSILTQKFLDQPVQAIGVLKGSFLFYSDLVREIQTDVVCDFIGVSSYGNSSVSSGEVKLTLDLTHPVKGRNVLLIEDIVDTGLTMDYLRRLLATRQPASITTVSLLHKPRAKRIDCDLDLVGFDISNEFVVGYGLDYQGYFRNLPYVAQVLNLN